MPTYLHPGVYIEEISGGARPIEAVGTSTAAFVGIAEKGPIDEARFVTNFTEFQQIYGGYVADSDLGKSYLAYSVYHFFQNGGSACYVVRVEDGAKTAELKLDTTEGVHTLTAKAVSPGLWGNKLKVAVQQPGTTSEEGFNLYVLKGDEIVESYEDLSMVDSSAFFVDRITKRSLYIRTTSVDLPDTPKFTGKRDLSGNVNLQNVRNIKLQIDDFGPYTIDCSAGAANVAAVTANEIRDNINKAFENDVRDPVASVAANRIVITSPTALADSKIVFTAPGSRDATYDIFGLEESSWLVTGNPETIAQALGLAQPDTTAARELILALGTAANQTITLAIGDSLFTVVSKINAGLGSNVAYTDGEHLVLSAVEDITIRRPDAAHRTDVNHVLGANFYSYVHVGSGTERARIEGTATIAAAVNGRLRLKIDTAPSFVVNFTGQSTAEAVAATINEAYQTASKSRRNVAEALSGNKIALNSINTGANGRIIVASHTGVDAAGIVLGAAAYQNDNDFFIPAELQSVARLDGTTEFFGTGIGAELADVQLRMAADGSPAQLTTPSNALTTMETLFLDHFSDVVPWNHRLLARVTATSVTVHMIAASLSHTPELRFSIPLTSDTDETTDQCAPAAIYHAAYLHLFGDQAPFHGNGYMRPEYSYTTRLPDNRPAATVLVSGEELDFSQSLLLRDGDQDRSNENRLRDLTLGSMALVTSGLTLLNKLTDVSLLVIPGWSKMSDAVAKSLIDGGIGYCDKMRPAQARPLRDIFYITAPPASVDDPTKAKDFVRSQISTTSAGGHVAIYYPWITVNDPIGTDSPTISVPPVGAIAGLYATIDNRRGVWKAPAGTEAGLAGVISVADQVNDVKQDLLNPYGVNVIRRIPGAGIVSWGARTLATNPEWKYIPVRRTAIMMEVSIYEGIQWAVFEPNDEPLWSSLRLNINAFMMTLFRSGAFQGRTPEEAFFVKCDAETTTQQDIDLGRVNILVGFAPLKPAEFVIVKISQKAGQKE